MELMICSNQCYKSLNSCVQEKGARAEITDIADWLLKREESYSQELGNMLFPFNP